MGFGTGLHSGTGGAFSGAQCQVSVLRAGFKVAISMIVISLWDSETGRLCLAFGPKKLSAVR